MQAGLLRNLLVTILLVALGSRKAPGQTPYRTRNLNRARPPVASYYPRTRQPVAFQLGRDDLAQLNEPTPAEISQGEPTPAAPESAAVAPEPGDQPTEAAATPATPQRLPAAADQVAPETASDETGTSDSQELPQPDAQQLEPQPGPDSAQGDVAMQPLPMNEMLLHGGHPAPTCSSGCWLDCGTWYTQDDFIYLSRQGPQKDRTLAFLSTGLLDPALLRTSRTLGYSPGARLTIGQWLCRDNRNRDHAIEATFFGFLDWQDSRGLEDPSMVLENGVLSTGNRIRSALDLNAPGFNFANTQTYTYQSELNTFEVNLRINRRLGRDRLELNPKGYWVRKCSPAPLCSLFAGARYLSVDERFNYVSQGNDFNLVDIPDVRTVRISDNSGIFRTSTTNDLIGLQAGTDIWFQHCRWRTGVRVKGGPFINFSSQSTRVLASTTRTTTTPAEDEGEPPTVETEVETIDRNEKATDNMAAFVGELSIMGQYQVRRNLAVRASYDLMWVNQVALALDQVSFVESNPPDIKTGGSLFLQGFSFGAEYVW